MPSPGCLDRRALLCTIAALALAAGPWDALAQWATSGSDINSTNSGNVGIGTSTPPVKLSVAEEGASQRTPVLRLRAGSVSDAVTFEITPGGTLSSYWYTTRWAHHWHWDRNMSGNVRVRQMRLRSNGQLDLWNPVSASDADIRISLNPTGNSYLNPTSGNLGIGTTSPSAKLHVVGNVTVDGNISAKYQDLAEWVPSRHQMTPATVVVLDPERPNHVMPSQHAYDTRVAGVISAQPGVLLGEGGDGQVIVATTGRVRVRVSAVDAPIRVGDLLVTGGGEGTAIRSEPLDLGGVPIHRPGTVIGKALERLEDGIGEVLVLLSLQ